MDEEHAICLWSNSNLENSEILLQQLLLNLMTTGKVADGQNPIYETKARKYRKELAAAMLPPYYLLTCYLATLCCNAAYY